VPHVSWVQTYPPRLCGGFDKASTQNSLCKTPAAVPPFGVPEIDAGGAPWTVWPALDTKKRMWIES
jgi:hypothetical protein